jgi:hypothetical protein
MVGPSGRFSNFPGQLGSPLDSVGTYLQIQTPRHSCEKPFSWNFNTRAPANITSVSIAGSELVLLSGIDRTGTAITKGLSNLTFPPRVKMAPLIHEEWTSYQTMFSSHVKRIAETIPVIELGVPEYCTFNDMFRFEPQKLLNC